MSEIQSLISDLSKDNLLFDAICFQETWLHTNDDVGIFHLPAYNIIHKGNICCGHGGLVIYLNNRYTHTLRSDLYKDSTIWEGLFIDIAGENIIKKITLGNIYTVFDLISKTLLPKIVACEGPLIMMTGSLKKRFKNKNNNLNVFFFYLKKGGGSLIRACSLIRSNTVSPLKITVTTKTYHAS